jgi:hypothetical protein
MAVTEHLRQAGSLQSVCVPIPIPGLAERMEPRLCTFRDICQSRRRQTMNTDCPGSRKGN